MRALVGTIPLNSSQSWEVYLCRAVEPVECHALHPAGEEPPAVRPGEDYIEVKLVDGQRRSLHQRCCRKHGADWELRARAASGA